MKKAALQQRIFFLIFSGSIFLFSCSKNGTEPEKEKEKEYEIGKNRYTLAMDGDTREYYVHVPTIYNPNTPTPVVFMLHGTTGDGERFYNISGWKEVGEAENILTVYPSSWRYCIIDDDGRHTTTKWNIYPGSFGYCAGEVPRDDVKFLRRIITELKSVFNVDAKRIYLVGFSNGGQMAFRCAVEMSDVLAAVVENAGSVSRDTTAVPIRNLPVTFQVGNEDGFFFNSPAPLDSFEFGLNNNPIFQRIVHSHTSTFQYRSTYTISGDVNAAMIATYPANPPGENRTFNMILVKGLGHQYPNGTNHWMNGAVVHWAWLKNYTLP
ncbi:MAG: alpha/beta hydrolase family esterase [bacterium]